jgi:hypothetical protein
MNVDKLLLKKERMEMNVFQKDILKELLTLIGKIQNGWTQKLLKLKGFLFLKNVLNPTKIKHTKNKSFLSKADWLKSDTDK